MAKHSHNHGSGEGAGKGRDVPAGNSGGAQDVRAGQGEAGGGREKPAENQVNNNEKVPEGAAAGSPEAKIAVLEAELADRELKTAELEAKLADLNDQYLRKAADFENFRKRMIREKQEITDFANQNLLLDLVPIIDDFERAIKSADTSKDFASFYEGIVMIEKRLSSQLESKWGLKRFDSAGEPFDPNRHEAIQMERATGITEAIVQEDYLKGYFLRERVIRCAKVKVLMPEPSADAQQNRAPPQADGALGDGQSGAAGETGVPGLDRENKF